MKKIRQIDRLNSQIERLKADNLSLRFAAEILPDSEGEADLANKFYQAISSKDAEIAELREFIGEIRKCIHLEPTMSGLVAGGVNRDQLTKWALKAIEISKTEKPMTADPEAHYKSEIERLKAEKAEYLKEAERIKWINTKHVKLKEDFEALTSERDEAVKLCQNKIAEAFRCLDTGLWEHEPFDDMNRDQIDGMRRAFGYMLRFLSKTEKP